MKYHNSSVGILLQIADTINLVGPKRFREGLTKIRHDEDTVKEKAAEFLISNACQIFHISRSKLINSNIKGIRVDALVVCYNICSTHLDYSLADIHRKFRKDPSVISRGLKVFKNYDLNIPQDKRILEKHEKLEALIIEFLSEQKIRRS